MAQLSRQQNKLCISTDPSKLNSALNTPPYKCLPPKKPYLTWQKERKMFDVFDANDGDWHGLLGKESSFLALF